MFTSGKDMSQENKARCLIYVVCMYYIYIKYLKINLPI